MHGMSTTLTMDGPVRGPPPPLPRFGVSDDMVMSVSPTTGNPPTSDTNQSALLLHQVAIRLASSSVQPQPAVLSPMEERALRAVLLQSSAFDAFWTMGSLPPPSTWPPLAPPTTISVSESSALKAEIPLESSSSQDLSVRDFLDDSNSSGGSGATGEDPTSTDILTLTAEEEHILSMRIRCALFEQLTFDPPFLAQAIEPSTADQKISDAATKEQLIADSMELDQDDSAPPVTQPTVPSEQPAHTDKAVELPEALTTLVPQPHLVQIEDMYYSLEHDAELLAQVAKEVEAEADLHWGQSGTLQSAPANRQAKTFIDPKDSCRYLFRVLASQLSSHPQKLTSLKKLVIQVKPSRSKWASDERVGQERLYTFLEKVLENLKNYTAHSIPFLRPVGKKEAPNYYDIIKHPMDLGTMSKKLKQLLYSSKVEFERDLDLIWSNCFLYNTYEDSIYRKHAHEMKLRALELMLRVPNITIRHISEVSAEDAAIAIEEGGGGAGAGTEYDDSKMIMMSTHSLEVGGGGGEESAQSGPVEPIPKESLWRSELDQFGFQTYVWRHMTLGRRLEKLRNRERQLQTEFPEQVAVRNSEDASYAYVTTEQEFLARKAQLRSGSLPRPCPPSELFFPEELCTPAIPANPTHHTTKLWNVEYLPIHMPFIPLSDDDSRSRPFSSEESATLLPFICRNIELLRRIQTPLNARRPFSQNRYPSLDFELVTRISSSSTAFPAVAGHCMRKVVSLLIQHVGFDLTDESALHILVEVAQDFLSKLARVLKLCVETYSSEQSPEEIVLGALSRVGTCPSHLRNYITRDIIGFGGKLKRIQHAMIEWHRSARSPPSASPIPMDSSDGVPSNVIRNPIISHQGNLLFTPLPWSKVNPREQIGLLHPFYANLRKVGAAGGGSSAASSTFADEDHVTSGVAKHVKALKIVAQGRKLALS